MDIISYSVFEEFEPAGGQIIQDGVRNHNVLYIDKMQPDPIWIIVRDNFGEVVGGINAHMMWDWCCLGALWVKPEFRLKGIGRQLVSSMELVALKKSIRRFCVSSYTFQASEFYKKISYVENGRWSDYPPGHSYVLLSKSIDF